MNARALRNIDTLDWEFDQANSHVQLQIFMRFIFCTQITQSVLILKKYLGECC